MKFTRMLLAVAATQMIFMPAVGSEIINVSDYGCVLDGVADDSACWTSAIAALPPGCCGVIVVPPGKVSCVFSGVMIDGRDYLTMLLNGSLLSACDHDVTVVTAKNLQRLDIVKAQINGFNSASATKPAIYFDNCVACRTWNVDANFGYNVVFVDGASTYRFFASSFSSGYGTADMLTRGTAGGWCISTAIDQNWPAGVPVLPMTINNWSAGASINTKQFVALSSGWWLQATSGGVTGSVAPAITTQTYTTDIVDGSVTWRLAGRTNHDSTRYDTGTSQVFEWGCDHSGPYRYGVNILNSQGGTPPAHVNLTDTVVTGINAAVLAQSGTHLSMENNQIQNCQLAGCAGLMFDGFSGVGTIHGNDFEGNVISIVLHNIEGGRARLAITGNVMIGNSSGVAIEVDSSSISRYTIESNVCDGAAIVDNGSSPKIVQAICP